MYDHTFFCAIKPSLREQWGIEMNKIIKPKGLLLAVVYPMTGADLINGPPFQVLLDDYEKALGSSFKLLREVSCPNEMNHSRRNSSNELVALFVKDE